MTAVHVVAIDVQRYGGELACGVSRGPRRRAGCAIQLVDDRGRIGRGECSPLPGFSRDDLGGCLRELTTLAAGPRVLALVLEGPLLDQLAALPLRAPAVRFAIETALLDLAGQRLDRPLAALLAERPRATLPLAALLDDDVLTAAIRARGITTVKVKIGRGTAPAAVRDAIGDDLALRLDANQSLAVDDLPALAAARAELVEEPLIGGLCECDPRDVGELPVAADESLLDADAWSRLAPLVRAGRLRALVLKPMALGGFSACFALATRAAAHDVAVVVTHLWDGPIALQAAAALALALPGRVLACGLDRHAGLTVWPPNAVTAIGEATIDLTSAAGLGA